MCFGYVGIWLITIALFLQILNSRNGTKRRILWVWTSRMYVFRSIFIFLPFYSCHTTLMTISNWLSQTPLSVTLPVNMEWVRQIVQFLSNIFSDKLLKYFVFFLQTVPNCLKQKAILNMIQNDVVDIRYKFGMTCYNPDFVSYFVFFIKLLKHIVI